MDTKLKKFNLTALLKVIAVLLCLVSVAGCTSQVFSSLVKLTESNMNEENFIDALTYNAGTDKIWQTESFKNDVNGYINLLSSMIGSYGGGSEESYKAWKKGMTEYNKAVMERTKENLITYLLSDESFYFYLTALGDSVISPLENVHPIDNDDTVSYYEEDFYDGDLDYHYLAGEDFTESQKITVPDKAKTEAEKLGADGVAENSAYCEILEWEDDSVIKAYEPGYYAYEIDEAKLRERLLSYGIMQHDNHGSYEQFRESYDRLVLTEQQYYETGRYFIMDSVGNTYTNMKGLSSKSTKEEIIAEFEKLGFYCFEAADGNTYLGDSTYYSYKGLNPFTYYVDEDYDVVPTTGPAIRTYSATTGLQPTMPSTEEETRSEVTEETTAVIHTTMPNDLSTTVKVTVPETVVEYNAAVMATTVYNTDNYSTPFIVEGEGGIVCYIGVDMNAAVQSQDNRFSSVAGDIEAAKQMIKDTLITCSILLVQFIVCFIFLILRSGRRGGDGENVYMFRLDNMFTDWRILIDGALGFGLVMLFVWFFDEFVVGVTEYYSFSVWVVAAIVTAFAAVVLDLVLFITRHIKNKSLFKRLFLVWLITKVFKKVSEKTEKAIKVKSRILLTLLVLAVPVNLFAVWFMYELAYSADEEFILFVLPFLAAYDIATLWLLAKEKKWLGYAKEKLQYVKGFEKETIIKGIIVFAVNTVALFFGLLEWSHSGTFFIWLILALFDIFVVIQLIRFIGGVKKIFSAVDEIKNGNYNVQINLFSLPSSLREPATKLMSLRDGLKKAVDEAVKQEQTKTELITNVSHDLKTPLTSIINYVELLKKCDIQDEDAKEYLSVLGEKSDRLKKLIEDLVEASKASTGNLKVEFMEVSLNEITSQIIGEYSDEFDKRGLSLITAFPEENITVRADSKMLYRVLENLMGNVSKYAMENTRVYLNVERRNGKGVIAIKNISGSPLNISAQELKARFVRGDESRTTNGNGLGLSIAESLCEIQGGKLNIIINGDLFVAEVVI